MLPKPPRKIPQAPSLHEWTRLSGLRRGVVHEVIDAIDDRIERLKDHPHVTEFGQEIRDLSEARQTLHRDLGGNENHHAYVVIVGTVLDGHQVHGPFATNALAFAYAEFFFDNDHDVDWRIVPLRNPNDPDDMPDEEWSGLEPLKPLPAEGRRTPARVTFTPQAWVRKNAIEVDPQGETTFEVDPEELRGYTADQLRYELHPYRHVKTVPQWIRDWTGPFYFDIAWPAEDIEKVTT